MRSDMRFPPRLRWTTWREVFDQWPADFRTAIAAIPQHEQDHGLKSLEIGTIDNRAADAPRRHQPRTGQDGQMRGHRVLRHHERLGDVAGCEPIRFVLRQQPEHVEPGRLGKRRQCKNGFFGFHISRLIDILWRVNLTEKAVSATISILLEIRLTGLDLRERMAS